MPLHRPNWPPFVKKIIPKGNISARVGLGRQAAAEPPPAAASAGPVADVPLRSSHSSQLAPRGSSPVSAEPRIPDLKIRAATNLQQHAEAAGSSSMARAPAPDTDAGYLAAPGRLSGVSSSVSEDETPSMTSSQAASFLSLQRRTGLRAKDVHASPVRNAAASTETCDVFKDAQPLQLHSFDSERSYDFDVTYQVGKQTLTEEAQAQLRERFPRSEDLCLHLKRLLAADFSGLPEQRIYPREYVDRHTDAFYDMEPEDPRRHALERWTEQGNQYTSLLTGSLIGYAADGQREGFESDSLEGLMLDPLEEERHLANGILSLPEVGEARSTLRVSRADRAHYSQDDAQGGFLISGKMAPGDFVTNYPLPMSTTSGVDLGQFSTLDTTDGEIRILDVYGKSGRPLLDEINPADATEKEELYHGRSAFQLVAAARAVPSDSRVCPRVVAIYQEVQGKDPAELKNIHTGDVANHRLLPL